MSLTIYDAAAGAGKTYTLVKNYLLKLLASPTNGRYKQILAITFTNKAVSEMKERILSTLYTFSLNETKASDNSMFAEIQDILGIESRNLRSRSLIILNFILHNYTAFSVQTIDKFTQSIIRTFAFDLNLSNSFEVQLDQKVILEEAVDQLLMEVGQHKNVTKVVLKYVGQQIEDDKSWDIKQLLLDLGMLLFNENDSKYITSLSELTIEAFLDIDTSLKKNIYQYKNTVKEKANALLEILEQENIVNDFMRGSLPKYFKNLSTSGDHKLDGFILKDISIEPLYAKSKDDSIKSKIDQLRSSIEKIFEETKNLIYLNKLNEGILKNLPAMSLLNELSKKIEILKKEKNQVLISEFNSLIAKNIKDQPTPFIYERLGEKYKDFFVDEFQDTSEVQWNNLTPLIDNALASYIENTETTGTATLVGDAKQSIYRWRGGKAEQFISLSGGYSPFSNPETTTFQLDTNYRSYSEIINFNNDFFSYVSDFLTNESYKTLYKKGNQQKINSKEGGYISFELFNANTSTEKTEIYPEAIKKYIEQALDDNFDYSDIAILVRKNSEGITISNYLIDKGIPVISSESLLIKNTLEVQLLEASLNYLSDHNNPVFRLHFIQHLSNNFSITVKSKVIKDLLQSEKQEFENRLDHLFNLKLEGLGYKNKSVYQLLEVLVEIFKLNTKASASLQFFLDIVFDFDNKNNGGIQEFLEYWNSKKDKLSIVTSESQKGVKVMTIHKSKGLEFPIVILPYLDESLYSFKSSNIWIENTNKNFKLDYFYWKHNKKVMDHFGDSVLEDYSKLIALEELDIINVLYVAFTRAERRLYLIGNEKDANLNLEKGNITSFLKDLCSTKTTEQENRFEIGYRSNKAATNENKTTDRYLTNFTTSNNKNQSISRPKKTIAIQTGDFVHATMAEIYDRSDLEIVFERLHSSQNSLDFDLNKFKQQVIELLNHDSFKDYFKRSNTILNERNFTYGDQIHRPDRIEISQQKEVIILDYKTGKEDVKHKGQLLQYQKIVNSLGYENVRLYLIYFDETLKILGL